MKNCKIFLFIFPIISCFGISCGGTDDIIRFGPHHKRSLFTRSSTYSPPRFLYSFQKFDLGSSLLNSQFNATMNQAVNTFYTNALKVKPIQGYLYLTQSSCGPEVNVPPEHQNPGILNTDMIIYITTDATTGADYVAYAGSCAYDSGGLGNILAGRVVVNVMNFLVLDPGVQFITIVHEITHILGFSDGNFNQ